MNISHSHDLAEALPEMTFVDLQRALRAAKFTVRQLAEAYLQRIETLDRSGPSLHSVVEINPDALAIAAALDRELAHGKVRSPLHGVPILLKDNIDSADRMLTTAGSLALLQSRPVQDATAVTQLRQAGALILGKTNLSEWANFRSANSISGWSARHGQTRNPYRLECNPSGSSSGSGVAVAANLAAAAIGTETDGSIVSPANVNGIVGLKPTVGLTSRAGVIPIAHSQDTVGPMTRTVADAAALLGVLTGSDRRDAATAARRGRYRRDYTRYLVQDGLQGARIGVARHYFGYHAVTDAVIEAALTEISQAGATILDPADLPTAQAIKESDGEETVLLYEFKRDLAAYLEKRVAAPEHHNHTPPRTLAELIAFNQAHSELEMPFFGPISL